MSLTSEKPAARPLDRQRIAELRVQCQSHPDALDLHREAAAEFLAGGLTAEALPWLRRLAARCPDDAGIAVQLASALAGTGQDRDALEQWRRAAELEPDSAAAQHNLGIAACRIADHGTALSAFERKLALDPDSFETCNDLAVLYALTGRTDDAVQAYRRCLTINPRYDLGRDNALRFLWEAGRFDEGLSLIAQLLEAVGRDDDLVEWQRRFADPSRKANSQPVPQTSRVKTAGKPTRVADKKIAFVASSDSFLRPIVAHFAPYNQIRTFSGQSIQELAELMRWADLTWFEWCDRFAIDGSRLPKHGKVVCRLHSYEAFTDAPSRMNWSNIDRLILVSESVGEILDQFWKVPAPRTVIHNGVDSAQFPLVPRPKRGKKVASVGYINYKKNPSLMLQTFKAIHTHDPEFEFHIAGDHQDPRIKVYFDHLLPRLNIPVTFHGWVDDTPGFYAQMDYVISTSLFESFHYSIAEGMLSGCHPLIHAWKGAERLYPPECLFNTPAEAIELIERYRAGDSGRIAREHRDYIIQRYEWEDRLDEIDKTLADVLSGNRPQRAVRDRALTLTIKPKSDADFGLVSIVIAAQDDAACINEAVTTALNQTYRNTEVIVCVDGATDDTESCLEAFGSRITVVRQVRQGLPSAFNTAIRHSRGEYIALLLACDAMAPERIEKQIRRLAASSELGFISCKEADLEGDDTGWVSSLAARDIAGGKSPAPPASTVMFRRDLLDHTGWFDEFLPGDDQIGLAIRSLWNRMQECSTGTVFNEPLVFLQNHTSNGASSPDAELIDRAHDRWARKVRSWVNHEFAPAPSSKTPATAAGGAKIVFVGATDPGGQMAMWAEAINRHTSHRARVLTHSETSGCPSDLVIRRGGHALVREGTKRSSMAILEEAAQAAADADLIVFAAGLAPGCLRSDMRLEDTDEQPYGTINWPEIIGRKKRAALLFGTPSVRANLSWYRDRFAAKGWPVWTCEPDIHRWLVESRYLPRLLSRVEDRFAAHSRRPDQVAIICGGISESPVNGADISAAATAIKARFPRASFGRCQDLPWDETLAIKGSACIGIDRIAVGIGTFGLDSLENSALGLLNVVYCDPYARALLAETLGTGECPWESPATTGALIEVLSNYIEHPDQLAEKMTHTKRWFETYWDEGRIVQSVADTLVDMVNSRPGDHG